MTNYIKDKVCYLGGHILTTGQEEYRKRQHEEVEGIIGVQPYSPINDESINDKANAVQEGLAERILENDFTAMQNSDVFVFDVLNEGLGTIAEMGIVLGMKHQAQKTIERLEEKSELVKYDVNGNETVEYQYLQEEVKEQQKILDKPVLVYCSDIRQGNGKSYTDPDRAEFSTNQFVYGVILSLTDGKGFISWEKVLSELEKIGEENV